MSKRSSKSKALPLQTAADSFPGGCSSLKESILSSTKDKTTYFTYFHVSINLTISAWVQF